MGAMVPVQGSFMGLCVTDIVVCAMVFWCVWPSYLGNPVWFFRFLVSLAVLGCGPCRGAVGRVGFRPSQMRCHCVSLALDMGDISRSPGPHIFPLFSPGSPSPLFSWVNHTPTLRQPKQARRVKQLCWWVVLWSLFHVKLLYSCWQLVSILGGRSLRVRGTYNILPLLPLKLEGEAGATG